MLLRYLFLQNFRNYTKSEFVFNKDATLIVGPNTSGKTNLIEAIYFLASGKSFRADKDNETIRFGQNLARISGVVNGTKLEVVITAGALRKYLVNGVSKRRVDFTGLFSCVLFSPVDLEIIVDSPGIRRKFLDLVLEQADREYRLANIAYTKGLRQRNALLQSIRERDFGEKQLDYWDELLVKNGEIITEKRERLIEFLNNAKKDIFDFVVFYDKSVISTTRLFQYKEAEIAAGVTLVGPHRDDMKFKIQNPASPAGGSKFKIERDLSIFGSRGEQRLVILQLKLLELNFLEAHSASSGQGGERPVLLLDDIFSELDSEHIHHVLKFIGKQQTIITTTHQEFIPKTLLKEMDVIKLE